jgi:hypothetical protein
MEVKRSRGEEGGMKGGRGRNEGRERGMKGRGGGGEKREIEGGKERA